MAKQDIPNIPLPNTSRPGGFFLVGHARSETSRRYPQRMPKQPLLAPFGTKFPEMSELRTWARPFCRGTYFQLLHNKILKLQLKLLKWKKTKHKEQRRLRYLTQGWTGSGGAAAEEKECRIHLYLHWRLRDLRNNVCWQSSWLSRGEEGLGIY